MTKKIMFLLTASILSLGIMTGCSGNSGNTQSDSGNNAVSQADTQNVSDTSADGASDSSVNTVIGSGITDDTSDNAGATTAATTQNTDTTNGYISEDDASAIALAKVEGATADELRIYKDTDDNRNIYEGSIYHDGIEYDFEIDAQTGDIIDWSSEKDDDNWSNTQSGSDNYISEKKARNIALGQVEGATESDLRIHKDTDDGRDFYEGSIIYNEMEYEFEIDAKTGDIIEWSSESIYD